MSEPAVVLEPALVAYVTQRGAAVTVRTSPRHGCCGGTVAVPVAEVGAPLDAGSYDVTEHDGVRVYVERGLVDAASGPITLGVEGFGRWRRLWVSGLEFRL